MYLRKKLWMIFEKSIVITIKRFFYLSLVMEPRLGNRLCPSRRPVQFLVADTELYKKLCPHVHPSINLSVHLSVRSSICSSMCTSQKVGKMSVLESCVCVCVGRGLGGALVVDGGWLPLPCPPFNNNIVTPRHLFISWQNRGW